MSATATSSSEEIALDAIRRAFEALKQAASKRETEIKQAKEGVSRAQALLATSIEQGLPVPLSDVEVLLKLRAVEGAWQDLTEMEANLDVVSKAWKDEIKRCKHGLEQAVENSKQLALPGLVP
jgi:hypothetical protein